MTELMAFNFENVLLGEGLVLKLFFPNRSD